MGADYLIRICETQRVLTNALESEALTEAAKNVAYYTAMIEAATDDPLDDPTEQSDILTYFNSRRRDNLAIYMDLVNNGL